MIEDFPNLKSYGYDVLTIEDLLKSFICHISILLQLGFATELICISSSNRCMNSVGNAIEFGLLALNLWYCHIMSFLRYYWRNIFISFFWVMFLLIGNKIYTKEAIPQARCQSSLASIKIYRRNLLSWTYYDNVRHTIRCCPSRSTKYHLFSLGILKGASMVA